MLVKENENLERYVTFRIGGCTSKMYIPESEEELIKLVRDLKTRKEKYYFLGNGSNILITDKKLSRSVILNTKSCDYINFKEDEIVEVGASVDIRKLIKKLIEKNLESPVALYTIPATLGGSIFQNASRGSMNVSISDNLLSVKYFDGEKICTLTKEECKFRWRYSIFHDHRNWVILNATFKFKKQSKEISEKKLKESLDTAVNKSYRKNFSAGSVFKTKSPQIIKRIMGFRIGNAEFSPTTLNTIHNLGKAKFKDVQLLIFFAKIFHWLSLNKVELEIEVWK